MIASLNTQILAGALLGAVLGMVLGHAGLPAPASAPLLEGLNFLGRIFIDLLKILMVPLVFTSIAAGIANLKNLSGSRRAWPALLAYSMTTTCLAAVTGLTAMNLIKPGVGLKLPLFNRAVLPGSHHLHPLAAANNIFVIIALAALTGIILIILGRRGQAPLKTLNALFEIIMKAVNIIMRLAPLGIMGLLAGLVAQANLPLLLVLSKYILVVMGTTLFHGLVTLPVILWLVTKTPAPQFFKGMKEALITAFATSSSTATLPVSLRCLTQNLGVDKHIARFVLPIGAVLNMDGTVMYEAMAALFVANLCQAHLSLPAQIAVMATAMLVSIGAPGIPSAGMVTMMMVLQSVGLPLSALGLLVAIDRPLDTVRTVVNVEGDCIGACVVQRRVSSTF